MTTESFNQLPIQIREEIIWEFGVFLDQRNGNKQEKILLFQVASFYAEIFYHTNNKEIKNITSFSDTAALDPYLKNINVYELISY